MKKSLPTCAKHGLLVVFAFLVFFAANAQFPYTETFKNSMAPGMVFTGNAHLTSGIADPAGEGFLRLTGNGTNEAGSAYNTTVFNSNQGLVVEFEYFVHGGTPFPNPSGTTGDGFSFFLFDGDASYSPGAYGGSLGYANKNLPPTEVIDGLGNAYIGIGLDEFGNFSSTYEGKNGGPGFTPSAVAIRGPGNGQGPDAYVYQTGQQTTAAPFNFPLTNNAGGRDPLPSGAGYRKVKIEMNPILAGGSVTGYAVTVKITTGGSTPVEHTVIDTYTYNFVPPPRLKFGFAASTGLATSYHEIRNLGVNVFDPSALTTPTAVDDAATGCADGNAAVRVTDNDFTPNGGGTAPYPPGININPQTVDLDVNTAGIQPQFTQAGIGTWSVDTGGVVMFVPVSGFTGPATLAYFVTDVYGETSATPGTISVTISTTTAPTLTAISPQLACAPGTVNITEGSGVWIAVPSGGTVVYSTDAAGINAVPDPAAINTSGLYYIRYTAPNGCIVYDPVAVTISAPAIVPAVSGNYNCGPGAVTLTASGAAAGETYQWYDAAAGGSLVQDGGESFTTPILTNTTPYWVTLQNASANGCESARVPVTALINAVPTGVNAGPDQQLTQAAQIQLAGSTLPAGQAGLWTQVSGPAGATIVEPTQPNATVVGLSQGTYVLAWTVQDATCTAADEVTIEINSVLPVTLVSFTGTLTGESVQLDWSTATESNSDRFLIERSGDGTHFGTVAEVKARGNSATLVAYSYTDQVPGGSAGRLYYRLKQLDLDGRFEYSSVVTVRLPAGQPAINVGPNPFTDQVNIRATLNTGGKAAVSLYNMSGARLKQYNLSFARGGSNLAVRLDGLAAGTYTLELIFSDRTKYTWQIVKR